jgi:hypothetical protein
LTQPKLIQGLKVKGCDTISFAYDDLILFKSPSDGPDILACLGLGLGCGHRVEE